MIQSDYICENDASNSTPGGIKGSQYPEDDPDEPTKEPAEEANTEERQTQNRLKGQEECKKECMENEEVGELLRVIRHNRIWQVGVGAGGIVVCAIAGLGGIVPGLICGGALFSYTSGKELVIGNLRNRIRTLGCSCVL